MEIVQQNETRRASTEFGQKVDVEQNGNNYFVYQQHSRLTHETNQSSHSSKSSGGLRIQDTLTPTNKKIGKIVNYEKKGKKFPRRLFRQQLHFTLKLFRPNFCGLCSFIRGLRFIHLFQLVPPVFALRFSGMTTIA